MNNSTMDTHLGSIQISNEVIADYAGTVATECFGIIGMTTTNVKDGLAKLLKKERVSHGIIVKTNNNKLTLDFHIIVAYGVNILSVTDNLISSVKYKIEDFTGLEVERINVFIEGVRVID